MADVIRKATNRFTKGLVMDFSPENTKNEVLKQALNATLLTFNGNELSLQNDMGNGRVETAFLPEGYMPVGTCEYGGIIYIVSYNPLEDKSQIGCFPSPERNISIDELGIPKQKLLKTDFQDFDKFGNPDSSGLIKNNTRYVQLKNDSLNPGDKFIISASKDIYNEKLADLWVDKDDKYYGGIDKGYELTKNPVIALNIVSIEDSGKIIYLNSSVRSYEIANNYTKDGNLYKDLYKYHILGTMAESDGVYNQKVDIDDYRNTLSSGYSVFKAKTSGKLAILAELIMIDSYSVTHSVQPKVDEFGDTVEGAFDVILHTEVTPELNEHNYYLAPKLQFYYLENSQGYLQTDDSEEQLLFNNTIDPVSNKQVSTLNKNFQEKIRLSNIYKAVPEANLDLTPTLGEVSSFNFPKAYTYHGRLKDYDEPLNGTVLESIYTKFTEGKYHRVNINQIKDTNYYVKEVQAKFYYFDPEGESYTIYDKETLDTSYTYYIRKEDPIYHDVNRNLEYKDKELYRLVTIPLIAEDSQIKDVQIEKFQEQEITTYVKATDDDIAQGKTLYYKTDSNTYVSLTGDPDDDTEYYIRVVEKGMVSIGFVISSENASGTIYYYPEEKDYVLASKKEIDNYYDFDMYPDDCPYTLYWKEPHWKYIQITTTEAHQYLTNKSPIYYNTQYIYVDDIRDYRLANQLFIVVPIDTFIGYAQFVPNSTYNYINGYEKPSGEYPKDDKIFLYTVSDFIPENMDDEYNQEEEDCYKYSDLKLASIKIPDVVANNGLDLPFKYSYTIVPCMNYGKLQHLAVSNTIDFSKLHAFNQSNFTTWKYYITNDQLRLTFGAEIYDTYEQVKVDGLILEFYDCWGFAGSIEITDKKSYSGIFTKIIPLNSFRAINRDKINGNSVYSDFKRNINIQYNPETKTYKYGKNENLQFDSAQGWQAISEEDDNDCGTLYSNLIYGVKTYIRRTNLDGTKEYIKKRDFFLFTLPIYNEYYNMIQDFSNLKNPELELMLTFKLKDKGTKIDYEQDPNIIGGYSVNDKTNVDSYLSGFYQELSLDLIKYYKYSGTSELFLEIGLKKEYEDINLNYDPEINSKFSCNLMLVSDDDKTKSFNVHSGIEGLTEPSQILNYSDLIQTSVNNLHFGEDPTLHNYTIAGPSFRNTNFINVSENFASIPLKINYDFIVGYQASINDIRSTQVQATTICALCHKQASGEYNYEDFGVYEQVTTDNEGKEVRQFLSGAMFYNEGTKETEVFGLCRQIATTGTMNDQLSIITSVETEAQEIKTAGKLNSGDPLKQLVGQIGKLTFCQPHAHGFSENNGVSIYGGSSGYQYGISIEGNWEVGDSHDDSEGIAPSKHMFEKPIYNLSVNTKNAINYNSEFLSTMQWSLLTNGETLAIDLSGSDKQEVKWVTGTIREFVGMTGQELSTFNQKLVETMKNIYAYNPGYDSLTVNVGNIKLQDYNPYFTSNLVSSNSKLNFIQENEEFFNNYINIGPISITNYLVNLYDHSVKTNQEITSHFESIETVTITNGKIKKFNPQVEFIPNFDYCGSDVSSYLITSLTYNTPVPRELEQELEFNASDMNVIKHSDGTNTYLKGVPNKKVLYGYHPTYNKMIQLDVSNYSIDTNGKLTLKDEGSREYITGTQSISVEDSNALLNRRGYKFKQDISEEESIDLIMNLDKEMVSAISEGSDGTFLGYSFATPDASQDFAQSYKFYLYPKIYAYSSNKDFNYTVKITSIEVEQKASLLNSKISISGGNINLKDQSYEVLNDLVDRSNFNSIVLVNSNGIPENSQPKNYYVHYGDLSDITANGMFIGNTGTINLDKYESITFQYHPELGINPSEHPYMTLLMLLKITKVNYTVTKTSKLETEPNAFVHTTRTTGYFTRDSQKYVVKQDYNDTRIKGTSITLNDLIYEPSQDGHRLFMRNNLWSYTPNPRGKIYYRISNFETTEKEATWDSSTKYYNNIFLFTGPCFTPDTLNT